MFAANLLAAAVDGEGIGVLRWNLKQAGQVLHPAEHRPLLVDAAAARACVEVDAPAIRAHHGQILLLLCFGEGGQGFLPFTRIQAAAGATAADAAPVQVRAHRGNPCGCDKPSQCGASSLGSGHNGP